MERKYLRKISFQGFGTKSPILHHNFHHKRHQVQRYYHLSQQFKQDFIELPWFDAYLWYNVLWIGNIFEIVIFQGFGTK